jgi:hypothetical protein
MGGISVQLRRLNKSSPPTLRATNLATNFGRFSNKATPLSNRDLRVVGYGYRPIRKSDAEWFSFGQSLVNPRGPQVLTATGLAVTKKADLFSQDHSSDENQSFR